MINERPTLIVPGDKVFLTAEGYKYFYINGCAKTLGDVQVLLSRLTVEAVDPPRGVMKLAGLSKVCRVEHVVKQLEPGPTDYPMIAVYPDLTFNSGNALDIMARKTVKVTQPIVLGRMPMGTKGGNATVFIVVEHPTTGETILAETTMKLFLDSAEQLRKFDNPQGN